MIIIIIIIIQDGYLFLNSTSGLSLIPFIPFTFSVWSVVIFLNIYIPKNY